MINKFNGEVKNGKFKADEPELFVRSFVQYEGKRVTVTVGRYRKPRSKEENNFFHGVVLPLLSEASGYDTTEIKGIVKFRFGIKHTSELSTVEFENFVEIVRWWAVAPIEEGGSGLDCIIPLPEQVE